MFVENRSTPLCEVPRMFFGSMPRDGGGFVLTESEKDDLIKTYSLKLLIKYSILFNRPLDDFIKED